MRPIIEELGELVTYVHGTGTGASTGSATGIYFSPYAPVVIGGNAFEVASTSPRFAAMSVDLPLGRGDTINIRSVPYKVTVPQPDPVSGVTVFELRGP